MGRVTIGCGNCEYRHTVENSSLQVGPLTEGLNERLDLVGIAYSFQLDEDPETKRSHYASSAPGECGESCPLQDPAKRLAASELLADFVEVG